MADSLAGKYKLLFRVHSSGRMHEPGAVVDLSHEDAETMLALKGAVRVPDETPAAETVEVAPGDAPKTNESVATPAAETNPPPKGDRKQK